MTKAKKTTASKGAPPPAATSPLEERVGPYTIRPWDLPQFIQITFILADLLKVLAPLGLTFENAETFLVEEWAKLLPEVAPFFPRIIMATLFLSLAEIQQMNPGLQTSLGLRILLQNRESLKDFLIGLSLPEVPAAASLVNFQPWASLGRILWPGITGLSLFPASHQKKICLCRNILLFEQL